MANLIAVIETGYIQTGFEELKKIANYRWEKGMCYWTCPLDKLKEFEGLIGKPIEFTQEQASVVLQRSPMPKERVDVPEFKGKGEITVEELPKCYIITEYRKEEQDDGSIEIRKSAHELPIEVVNAMREALEDLNEKRFKDEKITCRRLAEETCKRLNVAERYTRESGTFAWNKFFGERGDYYRYYYLPLKVLVHYNEAIHHKNGKITKLQRHLKG